MLQMNADYLKLINLPQVKIHTIPVNMNIGRDFPLPVMDIMYYRCKFNYRSH